MTSPTYSPRPYGRSRSAFTLVELLVVIAVIGILVGMLMVGLGPALIRVHVFAISTEIQQMESSMESFRTKYGFYPPSFEVFDSLTANERRELFKRYLNRIAPNHTYSDGQLDDWLATIGVQFIPQNGSATPGSDLVFWLSGLTTNKQFPLGDPTSWVAGNPNTFLAAHPFDGDNVEREVLFDFDSSRLELGASGKVAAYHQARGPEVAYRFASSQPNYLAGFGYQTRAGGFYNPDSIQIIAAGRDGLFGNPGPIGGAGTNGRDDVVSFADGILEKELLK